MHTVGVVMQQFSFKMTLLSRACTIFVLALGTCHASASSETRAIHGYAYKPWQSLTFHNASWVPPVTKGHSAGQHHISTLPSLMRRPAAHCPHGYVLLF